MNDGKRKFTKKEQLAIIQEVSEHGLKSTLEKHSLYAESYYSWKKKLDDMGEEGFIHGITPAQIKRIRELEKEFKANYCLSSTSIQLVES